MIEAENTPPIFLKVDEVAYELRCTPRHVQNLVARGVLPHVTFGRSVRVPRDALLAIAASATARDAQGED